MTLRQPVPSSIDSLEKSSNISIAIATYEYFLGTTRRNFSMALLVDLLKRGPAGTVATDACCGDGVPSVLGGPLAREGGLHLYRNSSQKRLQRPPILLEVGVAVLDRVPHVPRRHIHLHHHGPLGVVGAGVLEEGLDDGRGAGPATATTAPVRGRGGAPPVGAPRASISSAPLTSAEASSARVARVEVPQSPLQLHPLALSLRLQLAVDSRIPLSGCTSAASAQAGSSRARPLVRVVIVAVGVACAPVPCPCVLCRLAFEPRLCVATRARVHVRCRSRPRRSRPGHPGRPHRAGPARPRIRTLQVGPLRLLLCSQGCCGSRGLPGRLSGVRGFRVRRRETSGPRSRAPAPGAQLAARPVQQQPRRRRPQQQPTACSARWRWWIHGRSGRRRKGSDWTGWTWRPD
ncbi:uncharacterized protein [Miscanthus floridulus]|uniref:uncharacterized protein n=1 Tax=Miscanthus floridulus TaxID=154761 RepID=UPI0034599AC8